MTYSKESPEVIKAYELAKTTRKNAHAPYSKYQVGSSLKLKGEDTYFSGCNVENASYGGTICAERTAILSHVAARGKCPIDFIVIVTKDSPPAPPCGFCLQVMAEFLAPDSAVFLANEEVIETTYRFEELLPHRFVFEGS